MILSEKHRFLFLKGQKVAGTSIEVLLSAFCGEKDIITPITPIDEKQRLVGPGRVAQNYGADPGEYERYLNKLRTSSDAAIGELKAPKGGYSNHMRLVDVEENYGPIPADWTIFAVERNPYSKVISSANMKVAFADYKKGSGRMIADPAALKKSLKNLIDSEAVLRVRNIDKYKDAQGVIRATILRFEHLPDDLQALMASIGIENLPALPHLKKGIGSNQLDLSELFSRRQLKRVNELFHEEFESFGYPMID